MRIKLPYQFNPRPYQKESNRAFFIDGKHFSIEVLHRRAGKSKNAINFILMAAMQRVGNYFHTFPELTQARRAIWNNIDKEGRRYLDHIPRRLMDGNPNNTDMRIDLINGSIIQLAGADRYDALMGGNPAGIIFDEYSLQNPFAWHYLSPILTENNGWAKFVYTPRGMNHGWDLYNLNLHNPDWFVQKLDITQTRNWDGTPIITEAQIEERRRSGMPEELIQQEFYCSFEAALANAFYSVEIDNLTKRGRIKNFPLFKGVPVHTAWDIGRRDPTSIWLFQVVQNDIYVIGYYENVKKGMDFYIAWVNQFLTRNSLTIGVNFAPHDINVHEWSNGRSRIDQAASMGFYFKAVPMLSIMDGINCTRAIFPQFIFHQDNCQLGLNSLKQYVKNENGLPVHNFASHCFTGDTEILTSNGKCQIMNLPNHGEVLTLCGWKKYKNPRITRKNAKLVMVTFKDGTIVRCTPDHLFLTVKGWMYAKNLEQGSMIQSSLIKETNFLKEKPTKFGKRINTFLSMMGKIEAKIAYIELFGMLHLVKFPITVISTTRTEIQKIIDYVILNSWTLQNIRNYLGKIIMQPASLNHLEKKHYAKLPNGTNQKKVKNGIKIMGRASEESFHSINESGKTVHGAKNLFMHWLERQIHKDSVTLTAKPIIIDSVKEINQHEDVWCLTVDEAQHFSLCNGAIVHNCADAIRTFGVGWHDSYATQALLKSFTLNKWMPT